MQPCPASKKIKKNNTTLTLELTRNEDILATVAKLPNAPFCVGFAAESENLLEQAEEKRKQKNLPLIAANIFTESMGKDESTLTLLDNQGSHALPHAPKIILARMLLQHIAKMMKLPNTQ